MSIVFYIASYPPSKWAESNFSHVERLDGVIVDVNQYRKALELRWAAVSFQSPLDRNYVLEWTLPPSRLGFAGLQGQLSANGQIVTFGSGPKESFLDFILWHRSFVPTESNLYLFSSISNQALLMESGISSEEIINFTGIVD
jgi:hypothetical protein